MKLKRLWSIPQPFDMPVEIGAIELYTISIYGFYTFLGVLGVNRFTNTF